MAMRLYDNNCNATNKFMMEHVVDYPVAQVEVVQRRLLEALEEGER